MDNYEKQLWIVAKRRVMFKKSFAVYFVVNSFLCAVWFVTIGRHGGHFWPIWPILGWGIGIAMQYAHAYTNTGFFSEQKEYDKLKKEEETNSHA